MKSESTHASGWIKIWRLPRRIALAALGVAVFMSAAAVPAQAAGRIEANIASMGWPSSPIHAGEEFTVRVAVEPGVIGAPSLQGKLISLNLNGEMAAMAELNQDGMADLTVRPLATGALEFELYMGSDAHYAEVFGGPQVVQVSPAPTAVELIFDESYGTPMSFGGGEMFVIASVKSECAANASTDADEATCVARYGYPAGELVLTRDGNEIKRFTVAGSEGDDLAVVGKDLGEGVNPDDTSVFSAYVPVPDILPGSPEFHGYELNFVPSNWFGPAADSADVQLRAAPTSIEIFVGDDLLDPQDTVFGDTATLVAFVTNEASGGAPLSGHVRFFEGGEPISDDVPLVDGTVAAFEWVPTIGTSEYSITAEFVPATLNHEGSTSEIYPLTVIVTPAPIPPAEDPDPNPAPVPDPAPLPNPDPSPASLPVPIASPKADVVHALAQTGGASSSLLGFGGLFATAIGLMLMAGVAVTRRKHQVHG